MQNHNKLHAVKGEYSFTFCCDGHISSIFLKEGRIVYRGFKLPISITKTSNIGMKPHSAQGGIISEAAFIINDETAMPMRHTLRGIDLLLQEVMGNKTLFEGKVLVLAEPPCRFAKNIGFYQLRINQDLSTVESV